MLHEVSNNFSDLSELSQTLLVAVVDNLKNDILHGVYPPGSQLSEMPLARRYEASRTVIRESLHCLSGLGLVTLHSRRGAFVVALSPRTVREIYSLRALIEPFAIRLALTEGKIRSSEIRAIEEAFVKLKIASEQGDAFAIIEADMAFHWAVCLPCGHELLLESLWSLQTRTRQLIFSTKFHESDAEGEVDAHFPILIGVRAKSPESAESAMRHHITTSGERLLVRMLEAAEAQRANLGAKNR